MAPAISPLVYFSSNILVPPSTITAAASWRERSLITCQDAPAASATCAPETSAADTVCDFMDRSTIHGVAPACASTSATQRASLPFVSIVAKTAIIGLDALNNVSRAAVLIRLAGDTRQILLPEEVDYFRGAMRPPWRVQLVDPCKSALIDFAATRCERCAAHTTPCDVDRLNNRRIASRLLTRVEIGHIRIATRAASLTSGRRCSRTTHREKFKARNPVRCQRRIASG
jgi:hypothetical protein